MDTTQIRTPFKGSAEGAPRFVEHLKTELPPALNLASADVDQDGLLRLTFDPGLTGAAKQVVSAAVGRTVAVVDENIRLRQQVAELRNGDDTGRVELSATSNEDNRPTTEQVEARAREEGTSFGEALRAEIADKERMAFAFATPEAGMSEADRETELQRLINEKIANDPENYGGIND